MQIAIKSKDPLLGMTLNAKSWEEAKELIKKTQILHCDITVDGGKNMTDIFIGKLLYNPHNKKTYLLQTKDNIVTNCTILDNHSCNYVMDHQSFNIVFDKKDHNDLFEINYQNNIIIME